MTAKQKLQIKKTQKKGKGVFASREIKRRELLVVRNYSKLKRYPPKSKALAKSNHVDYVPEEGKYVIDNSIYGYINHSCEPNAINKKMSKNITKLYSKKKISRGEEVTYDYSRNKRDLEMARKRGIHIWKMRCNCGQPKCKKIIRGF